MSLNPQIMTAVEELGYRVTCGDVATRMGIQIQEAQRDLLALTHDTGGHLQVTDTGELIYDLPRNFRQILNQKYWQLQFQVWAERIGKIIFYSIKISFGIFLVTSIGLVYLAILMIALAAIFGSDGNCDCSGCGSCVLDIGSSRSGDATSDSTSSRPAPPPKKRLNFLEAVFSFIFGDGNPNADLERRRWGYIGNLINQQQGAIIAEQVAPFLDDLGRGYDREYEQYMLPILTQFNGVPEVSPTGQLVYHFPDLQATLRASEESRVPACLQERKWKFSKANPSQIQGAIALGVANLVGIAILSVMLKGAVATSGFLALMSGGLGLLTCYGVGFLAIPSVRYFWVKKQDQLVQKRNHARRQAVHLLADHKIIREKLDFSRQFAHQRQITDRHIVYRTDEDAIDQF